MNRILALVMGGTLAACGGTEREPLRVTTVDGEAINALSPGERATFDVTRHHDVLEVDQTNGRIDMTKVAILTRAQGSLLLIDFARQVRDQLDENLLDIERYSITGGVTQAPPPPINGNCNTRCVMVNGLMLCRWQCVIDEDLARKKDFGNGKDREREPLPEGPVNHTGPDPDPGRPDPTNPTNPTDPTNNPNPSDPSDPGQPSDPSGGGTGSPSGGSDPTGGHGGHGGGSGGGW